MRFWTHAFCAALALLGAACVWAAASARSFSFSVATGETIYLPQVDDLLIVRAPAVEYHAGTNTPRAYSAVLHFADAPDTGRVLSVNRPVAYRGHRFHLMSMGTDAIGLVARRNPAWPLLLISFCLVGLATFGLAVAVVQVRPLPAATAGEVRLRLLSALPLAVVGALFVIRTVQAGRLPFANMYEALLFFSASVLLFVVFTRDAGLPALLVGVGLAVTLFVLPARLGAIRPLPPALQSPLFAPHVALAFLGYGGLLVATLSPRRGPALPVAFAAFTLAVALGAIWAELAWSRFWSWDPKETWSLVTWVLMAVAVVMRRLDRPKLERVVTALALATVVYNFLVVNVILRGLHSYR